MTEFRVNRSWLIHPGRQSSMLAVVWVSDGRRWHPVSGGINPPRLFTVVRAECLLLRGVGKGARPPLSPLPFAHTQTPIPQYAEMPPLPTPVTVTPSQFHQHISRTRPPRPTRFPESEPQADQGLLGQPIMTTTLEDGLPGKLWEVTMWPGAVQPRSNPDSFKTVDILARFLVGRHLELKAHHREIRKPFI